MRQPASRFPAAALILLAVASSNCARAAELPPRGVLLRQSEWRGDVGTYHPPEAWMSLPTKRWPMDGWGVLNVDAAAATLTVSTLSPAAAREGRSPSSWIWSVGRMCASM